MIEKLTFCSQVRWWLFAFVLVATPLAVAQDAQDAAEATPYANQGEATKSLGQGPRQEHPPRSEADLDKSLPDEAPGHEMVGDLRCSHWRSDRDGPAQLATTANKGDQVAFSRNVSRLGAVYTLVPIAGGLYFDGILTGQTKLRETGLLGGEALVDSLIVSEVLKTATGRQRPLEETEAATSSTAATDFRPAIP